MENKPNPQQKENANNPGEPPVHLSFCRTICIDFDGTIVDEAYPNIGSIKPHAKELINDLAKQYSVLVLTNRVSPAVHSMHEVGQQQFILDRWKKENDLNIDGFVAYKPRSIFFIDNNAVRYDDKNCNWIHLRSIFEQNKFL